MRDIFQAMTELMDLNSRLISIDLLLKNKAAVEPAHYDSPTKFDGGRYAVPIERAVASHLFLEWAGRQGASSPLQMRRALDIEYVDDLGEDQEAACWYLEYAFNMVKLVMENASKHELAYDPITTSVLLNDIKDAASILGMTPVMIGEGRYHLCVSNAPVLVAASNAAEDEMRCFVEYLRFATKGDLTRKKELLASLYMGFEARRKYLEDNGCGKLTSTIGRLANNLDIRHNNTAGAKANPVASSMSNAGLEKWYDRILELYAEAVLAEQRIGISAEVSELSEKLRSSS